MIKICFKTIFSRWKEYYIEYNYLFHGETWKLLYKTSFHKYMACTKLILEKKTARHKVEIELFVEIIINYKITDLTESWLKLYPFLKKKNIF